MNVSGHILTQANSISYFNAHGMVQHAPQVHVRLRQLHLKVGHCSWGMVEKLFEISLGDHEARHLGACHNGGGAFRLKHQCDLMEHQICG